MILFKLKNSGQALVETLYSLPLLALGVSLVMGGLHSLFVFYLTDYWTYEAALCLAKEVPKMECQNHLEKKIQQIPMANININQLRSTREYTEVETSLTTPLLQGKLFQEKINLPLKSIDFGGIQ